jgi:hypothetical protein
MGPPRASPGAKKEVPMAALSHAQYRLVVADLLDTRLAHVRRLASGAHHEAALRALAADLDAHRPAVAADPDGLRRRVEAHTAATAALSLFLDAHACDPLADDALRAAAARLRDTLVEGQRGISVPAARRFEHAWLLNERRADLDADLARIPAVPSLATRVDAWLALGLEIGAMLGARTDRDDVPAGAEARRVCLVASSCLGDLRQSIRIELRLNPALPANLEAQILGLADTLRPAPRRTVGGAAASGDVTEPVVVG